MLPEAPLFKDHRFQTPTVDGHTGCRLDSAQRLRDLEPGRKADIDIEQRGVYDWGHKRLLDIAMDNLLGNAWRYIGARENARIAFYATTHDDDAAYIVKDNGYGFDMIYA